MGHSRPQMWQESSKALITTFCLYHTCEILNERLYGKHMHFNNPFLLDHLALTVVVRELESSAGMVWRSKKYQALTDRTYLPLELMAHPH